jgi:hypothetical protein
MKSLSTLLISIQWLPKKFKPFKNTVTCTGFAWRMTMGSRFDDWIYWHFLQLRSIITAHTLNSFWTTSVWWISPKNLSLLSESRTGIYYSNSRIHCFYNFHAARIKVIMSYNSSVLLCCHENAFVNIRCRGNKCLPGRCLAMDVCSGSTIQAFSRHVTILKFILLWQSLSSKFIAKRSCPKRLQPYVCIFFLRIQCNIPPYHQ